MRIVSGKNKGLKLKGPYLKKVRPAMDKIKDSIFSLLLPLEMDGLRILDVFAGTGSVGLEAISRGGKSCHFVETNKLMAKNIYDNIKLVKCDQNCKVINKDFRIALKILDKKEEKFDIIFSDPPYNLGLVDEFLKLLINFNILNKNGIVVMEIDRNEVPKYLDKKFEIVKQKEYGRTNIMILKHALNLEISRGEI